MAFGNHNQSLSARTQEDIVQETIEAKPSLVEASPDLPGLQDVLNMSEHDLVSFFTTVLKMRTGIREIDLTVGEYGYREVQSRVPGSATMHEKSFDEMARIIVLALQADPKVVGIRVRVEQTNTGGAATSIWLKIGEKEPIGPDFDEEGNPTEPDSEFNPTIRIYHSPRA